MGSLSFRENVIFELGPEGREADIGEKGILGKGLKDSLHRFTSRMILGEAQKPTTFPFLCLSLQLQWANLEVKRPCLPGKWPRSQTISWAPT